MAQAGVIFASRNKNNGIMKNTEYNVDALSTMISSDAFSALKDMIEDLGLEVLEVSVA